jgi:hypothetical protein
LHRKSEQQPGKRASASQCRRAAAIVNAIAAWSQHSTISNISHRIATSTSTPAIAGQEHDRPAGRESPEMRGQRVERGSAAGLNLRKNAGCGAERTRGRSPDSQ